MLTRLIIQFIMLPSIKCSMLVLAILIVACGSNTSTQGPPKAGTSEKSKQSATRIYAAKCQPCHGQDGNACIVSPIALKKTQLTKEQIKMQITQGKGAMPGFSNQLSPDEIELVTQYVIQLKMQ